MDWFLHDRDLCHARIKKKTLEWRHYLSSGVFIANCENIQQIIYYTETYTEPCQTSTMKLFAKIISAWKP